MAHSLSAKKRLRQNEKRRLRNRSDKSEIKTLTKKLMGFVEGGDAEGSKQLLPALISKIDKAARRHVFHANTAARRKSRLAKAVDDLSPPRSDPES